MINMDFFDLKIKEIDTVVKYTPTSNSFTTKNRINHIIGIQLAGKSIHKFKSRQMLLESPSIYFFNQRDDYSVDVIERSVAFSVHFKTYEPIDTDTFFIHITQTNEIVRLLNIMEKEIFAAKNRFRLFSYFYYLCSLFSNIYEKKYYTKDIRIINAEKYISAHFKDNNCLHDAAKICNLTQRRFNDLFKNHFDTTPNRYITNLKINYAKKLLQTNYLTVSQIAEMCGFKEIYYFSKLFKKETGFTPTEYKNKTSKRI